MHSSYTIGSKGKLCCVVKGKQLKYDAVNSQSTTVMVKLLKKILTHGGHGCSVSREYNEVTSPCSVTESRV